MDSELGMKRGRAVWQRQGFTLIEWLVVSALVALLLAGTSLSLSSALDVMRTRSAEANLVAYIRLAQSVAAEDRRRTFLCLWEDPRDRDTYRRQFQLLRLGEDGRPRAVAAPLAFPAGIYAWAAGPSERGIAGDGEPASVFSLPDGGPGRGVLVVGPAGELEVSARVVLLRAGWPPGAATPEVNEGAAGTELRISRSGSISRARWTAGGGAVLR